MPLVAAMAAAFFLVLFSQVAATPIGEGMDVDGHLAYIVFMVREGRAPLTGEPSVPADIQAIRAAGLASDTIAPGSYARWARLSASERDAVRRDALTPNPRAPYVSDNYQAQHPPLYYAMAGLVDRLAGGLPYDRQLFWLGTLSAALSAAAIPALWLTFRRRFDVPASLALLTLVAWYPNLMPFLGRATNDALAFPILCWLVWAVDRDALAWRHVIGAGLLLLAGLYTKTYFVAVVPLYLAICLARGPGARRVSIRGAFAGAGIVAAGLAPLVVSNLATTGLWFPVYEARLTAAQPLWRKLAALLQVDWRLFPVLMVRGAFWSGYWSWVAPGPWYYLPVIAPLLLWLPWPRKPPGVVQARWWRTTVSSASVPLAAWGLFLLAMWWHAALLALHARVAGRATFLGGEGWYLNVLIGCTATIAGVAVRERYGQAALARVLAAAAAATIAWNLIARLTLVAFWGGSVGLWSGLRFARFGDVVRALGSRANWSSWLSWPGVTGPAWLVQALPIVIAIGLSVEVLRRAVVLDRR